MSLGVGEVGSGSPRRIWRQPDLSAVTLGSGLLRDHYDINRCFLMDRPLDGLLYPFRDAAGLRPAPVSEECFGVGYGEFCGAWVMAACSICEMTGDAELRAKLDAILDELVACARTTPDGYLPISSRTYPAYYTRGVMLHALRAAAQFTRREDVQRVLTATTDHAVNSLRAMTLEQARRVVRGEYPWWDEGNGLCEILSLLGRADALDMVGGRFLRDPLARNEDILQHRHANAASMLIMGWPAAYELTGERAYIDAFFNSWRMILARTYVTGGSCDEYGDGDWEAWPATNDVRFIAKTQETCTAFHWLRHNDVMLSYSGEAQYGDMIERVLYNKLLISHQANGAIRYWTDMRDFARFEDCSGRFTCCSNSGVRAMATIPRYLYYLDDSGPIINLYANSTLRFTACGAPVTLAQETEYPNDGRVQITISCTQPCVFNLRLRVPGWAGAPVGWRLNSHTLPAQACPGSYASISRTWQNGDILTMELPMTLHTERARNNSGHYALLCGPVVLAGVGRRPFLQLVGDAARPDTWLKPVASSPLTFEPVGQWTRFEFKPFHTLGDDETYNLHFALSDSYPLGTGLRQTDDGLIFAWP
jgi:uncharacterized protein